MASYNRSLLSKVNDDFRQNLSGLVLLLFGTAFAEITYFVGYPIVYTAIGISSIILGATILLTPSNLIPKSIVLEMMRDSYGNCEAILAEFPSIGACKYMPPGDGNSFVQIPVDSVVVGDDVAEKLAVPMGAQKEVTIYLPISRDTLSKIPDKLNMEKALNFVVRDHFELAKSLKVRKSGNQIIVRFIGIHKTNDFPLTKLAIGSEPTSIAGCVLSYISNISLTLSSEEYSKFNFIATFDILE
jgi:hypothetical protein